MKLVQVFLKILILIKILTCESTATYRSRLANRKQQKLIEGSMDMKADPCEDFYQYACGNWENLHREAGDKYLETMRLLEYNANKELLRVFNRINLRYKPKFIRSAYEYYKSCKDLTKYETVQYIKWLKENEDINLPLFWTPSEIPIDFDWLKTLATMRIYGLSNIFIEETVMQRRDDPSKYIIDLDKPVTNGGFKPLTYEELKLLIDSSGVSMKTRTFTKLWYEIKDFELKLMDLDNIEDDIAEQKEDKGDVIQKDSHLATVKDLPLPWLKEYLRIILNQTVVSPNMEILVQNMPYMRALDKLLKRYTKQFLCKYLELRFLKQLDFLPPRNFFSIDCVSSARSFLPMAMNWLYEQQHPELKQEFPKIMELFNKIRIQFNKTILTNNNGFDSNVVKFLLAKLNNMQLKINNIPRKDTVSTLENYYKTLNLNASEFYANNLKLLKFDFEAHHNLLNPTMPEKDLFFVESVEVAAACNSFFIRSTNTLIVPLTLLQQPIYHVDLDDIYKYSSLGFLLARDVVHGFDDIGVQYDYKGRKVTRYYYDVMIDNIHNASQNCYVELSDEKIADITALPLVYELFLDSYPDVPTKYRRIYGRDMSLSQLFFLNFAQYFCGTSNSEEFIEVTKDGTDHDRVIETLSQFADFSKTYQCTVGNHMYTYEMCHMWRR